MSALRRLLPVTLVALSLLPAPAAATGAWTTLLRATRYSDLLADGDTVWCATLDAGLLRFSRSRAAFDQVAREPGSLASNRLTALTLDRSRRLWVGTEGSGASRLATDRTSWSLVNVFDGLPSDTVTVLEAQGDTVWVGTAGGLALWNGVEIAGTLPDGVNPSPFASNIISGVAVLGDTLWVATHRGVYHSLISEGLDPWIEENAGLRSLVVDVLAWDGRTLMVLDTLATQVWNRVTRRWDTFAGIGAVRSLSDDRDEILAATSSGIQRWNGAGWTLLNSALQSPGGAGRTFAIAVDESGSHVAANQTGLYVEPPGGGAWPGVLPPGPPGNNILNLDLEGSRLYLCTLDEGIGRFDGVEWRNWVPAGVSRTDTTFRDPRFAFALLVDDQSRKWFGCWAPLRQISPNCVPDTGAIEILEDGLTPPRVTHRIGGEFGPARHSFAWASALDSLGGHWFGLDSPCREQNDLAPIGLDYYDVVGNYVVNYRPDNSELRNGKIHALAVDRTGRMWVGYSPGGLDRFDLPVVPGGPIDFVEVANTRPLDVQGIVPYGDSLWVLTTSELRRHNLSGTTLSTYVIPAGPTTQTSVRPLAVAPDGTVWVGTANGIRTFRPGGGGQDLTVANSPLADDEVRAIRIDPATGVVWIGTARGLNRYDPGYVPPALRLPLLEMLLYPNPVRLTAIGLGLKLRGNGDRYRGAVLDLGGRVVRRFTNIGNGQAFWDGLDGQGERVRPGIYFIRVEAAGRAGSARVVVIR